MELVNDEYWLGFARTKINEGFETLSTAAKGLTDLLGLFLAFYTPAVAAGTILLQSRLSGLSTILLVAPVPLLMIAYCIAQWAQMPLVSKGVDPRIPRQVEEFYRISIGKKKMRLFLAGFFTFLSSLSIAIALVISNVNPALKSQVEIAFDKTNPSKNLFVSGNLPEKAIVWIILKSIKNSDIDSTPPIVTETTPYHSVVTHANHFDFSTAVPTFDALLVEVYWKESEDAELTNSYQRRITP
jgi:hypothetical protein